MTQTSLTRTVDGTAVPDVATYVLDASHTHVGFKVRHLMVSKVRGVFHDVAGIVVIADDPHDSSVEVTIGVASVDTGDEQRDGHLTSPDFFDVEAFPTLTYRSTGVTPSGRGRYTVDGELTVKGVTRPVALEVAFDGAAGDPWGGARIGFSATAGLDREDFGLTWNQALETGGVLVGKTVEVEIEAEAVMQ